MISRGDFNIFTDRPISLAFLAATVLFLAFPGIRLVLSALRDGRKRGTGET
jgi:TctA family transporter